MPARPGFAKLHVVSTAIEPFAHDYADLFGALFDEVDAARFRRSAEQSLGDPVVEALARRMERGAVTGELTAASTAAAISGADPDRARFGALLGLDRAFQRISPLREDAAPPALRPYASRYRGEGR